MQGLYDLCDDGLGFGLGGDLQGFGIGDHGGERSAASGQERSITQHFMPPESQAQEAEGPLNAHSLLTSHIQAVARGNCLGEADPRQAQLGRHHASQQLRPELPLELQQPGLALSAQQFLGNSVNAEAINSAAANAAAQAASAAAGVRARLSQAAESSKLTLKTPTDADDSPAMGGVRKRRVKAMASNGGGSAVSTPGGDTPGRGGNKGLRHFSLKVCEKVQVKGKTNYNEVADELVEEFRKNGEVAPSPSAQYDEKNIRRRVYDALNVLMAMDIIQKEKKDIIWRGLPTTGEDEIRRLEAEREATMRNIDNKQSHLQVPSPPFSLSMVPVALCLYSLGRRCPLLSVILPFPLSFASTFFQHLSPTYLDVRYEAPHVITQLRPVLFRAEIISLKRRISLLPLISVSSPAFLLLCFWPAVSSPSASPSG